MISYKSVNRTLTGDLARFSDTQDVIEFLFGTAEGLVAEEHYAEADTLREATDSLSARYTTLTEFAGEIARPNFQVERLKDRVGE